MEAYNDNGNDNDNWDDVRDLVEPLAQPRIQAMIHESELQRRREMGYFEEGVRRELPANRFREFQLVASDGGSGSDGVGGDGSNGHDGSAPSGLGARGNSVPSWSTTAAAADGPSNDAADRLGTFLFQERPQTVVVWLSPFHFVASPGPGFAVPSNLLEFQTWAGLTTGGHCLPCLGVVGAAATDRRLRAETAAAWLPVVGALVARSANVTDVCFCFDHDVGAHLGFLEAIVSPAPPPEGRLILLNDRFVVTGEAARIVARCTHRDTTVQINLTSWSRDAAAVLAEAVRTSRFCPHRLAVAGATQLEKVEPLAGALRVARCVEELDLDLPGDSEQEARRCSRLLLGAIGDNVGLRKLTVNRTFRHASTSELLKEFWTSALRSRTLTTVNVESVSSRAVFLSGPARRELTLHVVDHLRSNRVLTGLRYDPRTHDPDIMEAQAVPLLRLNRLRSAAVGASRFLGAFLGSPAVRRHPMLRYHLLRSNVGTLVRHHLESSPPPPPPSR
jgi:hypothetical protein